jgi:hypothetical protein
MSADPAVYDGMTIFRGLTFTKVFICKNSDSSLVDLTGKYARFTAKETVDAEDNVFDLTASPGLVMGGTAGTITVIVDWSATEAITADELHYCLKISDEPFPVDDDAEVDGLMIGVIPVDDRAF